MNEGKPAGQRVERVQRLAVPGRKGQFKHSRVTDATGKGLAPVWRVGCLGRDPDPAKAGGPMKSQTPATGRNNALRGKKGEPETVGEGGERNGGVVIPAAL